MPLNGQGPIGADCVELWVWQLERRGGDLALLSEDEQARAARFRLDLPRDRFIAARAGMRTILGRALGLAPAALRFGYGPAGKPALPDGLSFNLSHSDGLAALAVAAARDLPLGIDIERIRPVEPELADRFFAHDEAAALRAVAEPDRLAAFFAGWTRKEAFVKARGVGLIDDLAAFSVSLDSPPRLLRVSGDPAEAASWRLADFAPAPGYVGAIAARSPSWRLVPRSS